MNVGELKIFLSQFDDSVECCMIEHDDYWGSIEHPILESSIELGEGYPEGPKSFNKQQVLKFYH